MSADLLRIAAVAAVYFGAAKLGLSLAVETESITAVWPPTGIALAAIVLLGNRVWPGVALGAFLANVTTDVPLLTVAGITVGNTLEAMVGAYLLRRFADFRPSLERVRDVIALVLLAGVVSTTISATIGVASLFAGDAVDASFGIAWRTWWLGDLGGAIVVAPALMVAATQWPFARAPGRPLEALALALALAATTALVFTREVPIAFVLFPLLCWAALRFWQPGAVGASLLIAGIAIPLTADDVGIFSGLPPDERLLLAQGFVGVATVTSLMLAAVITERQRAEEAVEAIADTLQESLLPARIPVIPGIETAVEFRPAGEEQIVGGDFYDVTGGEDGAWGIAVGDVRGKDASAAAVTALARYTLRAAAAHERAPSLILSELNDAMLHQAPGETCTVAYARVELDHGRGARVTLSTGGHPLPLVLRAGGRVEELGRAALVLGVETEPMLVDDAADLDPGDTLVLYTDGLVDAYAPRRIVSPYELAEALASFTGRTAGAIASELREAVLGPDAAEPRDDILVFVLRVLP